MFDYKNTLNILSTPFEMKGNLAVKEPKIQKEWLDKNVYEKLLNKNKKNQPWILHDGPPYANGNIHVGHALNKIIKDVIVRYANLKGHYAPFVLGWDTHGLPIEHALLKNASSSVKTLSISDFRGKCKEFANKYIALQKEQFSRLGLFTNLNEFYVTYDNDFENRQLLVFANMIQQGLIYQDLKPVFWSWSSQSALADAEVEYFDCKSPSIYVTFDLCDNKVFAKGDKLIIWTTTPWTIPANLAIAYHPNFIYCRVSVDNNVYVLAKDRVVAIANELGWKDYKVLEEIKGAMLEGISYKHCLYDRKSPLIAANYVSNDDGTGLVHNAPDFGEDDYLACKKYDIHPFNPLDAYCKFTKEINDESLVGVFYDDANKLITERLSQNNHLLKLSFVTHSAAIDWRTKKPVIYRATKQWFVNIKKIQPSLLNALEKVSFANKQNKTHIVDMIKNRFEWCISRQRTWGVPIPIIYHNDEPIFDMELITHVIDILKKETCNVWYQKPVEYFLNEKYKKMSGEFRKEKDIMDVWFDSGTSFTYLPDNQFPANLYFEGNDQYRGWFNSSLINGVVAKGLAPYKALLSHGFVLDEQGRKMSKSVGNVVDPLQICNVEGADVLRIWACHSNYQEDVRIGKSIISQNAEIYRRIRNTLFKFILANLTDFDYEKNKNTNFSEVSCYILSQLQNNIKSINEHYESYDFSSVIKTINNHVIELSSWYFDLIKDTLYCDLPNDSQRREVQTVLYTILKTYLIFLTPIIPHTCEEVYSHFNVANKQSSAMLEDWITQLSFNNINTNVDKWKAFLKLKDVVYNELENIRKQKLINKNTQALVKLSFDNHFNFKEDELKTYLNVAKVVFVEQKTEKTTCQVSNANLVRCERCWNYYEQKEINAQAVCKRCAAIISSK